VASPLRRRARGARIALALTLLAGISAWSVLRQIDGLLKGMHVPGAGSYEMSKLVQLFPHPPGAHSVVATWQDWQAKTDAASVVTAPRTLADVFLVVDTFVFVPAYAALLIFIVRRLRARIPDTSTEASHRKALGVAVGLVALLVVCDWGENICQAVLVHNGGISGGASLIGSILWALKWGLLVVVVLIAVAGSVAATRAHATWSRLRVRQAVVCRMNVLLAVFLLAVLFGPATLSEQAADVLRRIADDWSAIGVFLAILVALAAAIFASSSWLVANSSQLHTFRTGNTYLVLGIALGVSAAVIGLTLLLIRIDVIAGGRGLLVAAGIASAVSVMSLFTAGASALEPADATGETFVPAVLGTVPVVGTGLAIFASAVGALLSSNHASVSLLVLGVMVTASGFVFYGFARYWLTSRFQDAVDEATLRTYLRLAAVAGLLAFLIGLAVWVDPWSVSRIVDGTIGAVLLFCLAGVLVGFVLVGLADIIPPPPIAAFVGFRRIPMITFLLVWFVLSSYLDPIGFHSIRTRAGSSSSPETIEQAFARWKPALPSTPATAGRQPKAATASRRSARRAHVVPLVFVSAVGGGVRAAYWTALVLGCLIEKSHPCEKTEGKAVPRGSFFAASGASGGSLGIVSYVAQSTQTAKFPASPAHYLRDDYLAPTMARMLFVDLPNSFLRFQKFDDRAAILEKAWERSWRSPGVPNPLKQGLFARAKQWPILFLNGTSVIDGCRFETSAVATSSRIRADIQSSQLVDGCLSLRRYEDPQFYTPPNKRTWPLAGTKDLASYLCTDKDVRLSTAALLSARFPFVSPSGRVRCEEGPSAYVVDGGYWDNTASSTIIEIYDHLRRDIADFNLASPRDCIVPFLIQIDNHYLAATGPGHDARPKEILVPTNTLSRVRVGREADTREEAALLFSGTEFAPGQVAHLPPGAQDRQAHLPAGPPWHTSATWLDALEVGAGRP
jgi:hypothetical protein